MRLAHQALASAERIQKALVMHCDQDLRNLIITQDHRAVSIDFDRAVVLDKVDEQALVEIKEDLTKLHKAQLVVSWESGNSFRRMLIKCSGVGGTRMTLSKGQR
jgi:RIO-like serine/threonine protein kinase